MPMLSAIRGLASSLSARVRSFWSTGYSLSTSVPLPTTAGANVNETTALSVTAVWRAVNLYCNTIAALEYYVAESLPSAGYRRAPEHPLYRKIRNRPSPEISAGTLRSTLMLHSLTAGVGYCEIERDDWTGEVARLHLLDPYNVQAYYDGAQRVWYHLRREDRDIPARDMLVMKGLGWNGILPFSPIALGREELGTAMSKGKWEGSVYGNGARIAGHYEYPGNLSQDQKDKIIEGHNAKHQGPEKAHKVGILSGGVRWVQDQFSPADTELILSRGFSVEEVARLYQCQPYMIGKRDGSVPPLEEQLEEFYTLSLLPRLSLWEEECNYKLFQSCDRDTFIVRHSTRQLLRGNITSQTAYYTNMFNIGVFSQNDILAEEAMNPIATPSANKHWVPVNNLAALEDMDGSKPRSVAEQDPDDVAPPPVGQPPVGQPPSAVIDGQSDRQRDLAINALADPLGRMIRRECQALGKLAKRDGFADSLPAFFEEHKKLLRESITPAAALSGVVVNVSIDAEVWASEIAQSHEARLREAWELGGKEEVEKRLSTLEETSPLVWARLMVGNVKEPGK